MLAVKELDRAAIHQQPSVKRRHVIRVRSVAVVAHLVEHALHLGTGAKHSERITRSLHVAALENGVKSVDMLFSNRPISRHTPVRRERVYRHSRRQDSIRLGLL